MTTDRRLNNILHFLAPIFDAPLAIDVRDDYILETPIGCFRVAYSPATHTTALFYARHSDTLAATHDETGSWGIAHKGHVILFPMYKVHHDPENRWNITDSRQQFDLTWVRREIARATHDIPRIQFREANLHRVAKDYHASVFVGYHSYPSSLAAGQFSGDIITKTDENYRLPELHEAQPKDVHVQKLFRWFGRQMTDHGMGSCIALRSIDPVTNGFHSSFKKETMRDVELADFANRLQQIWEGLDPVLWKEAPLLPIYRGTLLHDQLHKFDRLREEDPEGLLRQIVPLALHLMLDGGVSALGGLLIEAFSEFGTKEQLQAVPPEWRKIIDRHSRRLVSIDSELHKRMIRPVPEEFGDFRWLNPEEHLPSFAVGRTLLGPDPERVFRRWARSLFRAPYAMAWEYRGVNDRVVTPEEISETKFISMQASDGMMLYLIPETGKLYAYYNRQDYRPTERKLPADARDFLKSGEVLEFAPKDWDGKTKIVSFADFRNEIRRVSQTPDLALPSADAPTDDMIGGDKPLPTTAKNRARPAAVASGLC